MGGWWRVAFETESTEMILDSSVSTGGQKERKVRIHVAKGEEIGLCQVQVQLT